MTWRRELEELELRKQKARAHGGAEKVEKHHAAGKLTVRERIHHLVDPGSFEEIGSISGFPQYDEAGRLVDFTAANIVCGLARIAGAAVFVTGDDFTVRGGANDGGVAAKFVYAESFAQKWRIPLVRLVDGSGGGSPIPSYCASIVTCTDLL